MLEPTSTPLTAAQQIAKLLKECKAGELQVIMELASERRWEMQKEERKRIENP